jgi:hypothetical protein
MSGCIHNSTVLPVGKAEAYKTREVCLRSRQNTRTHTNHTHTHCVQAATSLTPGKDCSVTHKTVGLVGPHSWSGRFGKEQSFSPAKVEARFSCPYCAHYLAILCDDYFKYVGQIILNCHLGDDKHVSIGLRYFSICTDIRIDQ